MKSQATVIQEQDFPKLNEQHFEEFIKRINPELFMIHIALEETGIDAMIIPHIIRVLGNLTLGAGYGKVQIYMQAKVVTDIESTEKIKVDREAVNEK